MGKVIMDDVDIVNIAQLAARKSTAEVTGQNSETLEREIVMRMSDRALDWYLSNLIPIVGRPQTKQKWAEWRK